MPDRRAAQIGLALVAVGVLGDLALFAALAYVHRQSWVGVAYLGCALAFAGSAAWLALVVVEPSAEAKAASGASEASDAAGARAGRRPPPAGRS